jgi:hypothetical protein
MLCYYFISYKAECHYAECRYTKWRAATLKGYRKHAQRVLPGSAKANRREHKTCFCRVFNYKFDCFDDVHVHICVNACPHQ